MLRAAVTFLFALMVPVTAGNAIAWAKNWNLNTNSSSPAKTYQFENYTDEQVCKIAKTDGFWATLNEDEGGWVQEAKRRGLPCIDVNSWRVKAKNSSNKQVCSAAVSSIGSDKIWRSDLMPDEAIYQIWFQEAEDRGLHCGVNENSSEKFREKFEISQKQIADVTIFHGEFELPDQLRHQPNDATLWYYYKKVINQRHLVDGTTYKVQPSDKPRIIGKVTRNNEFLEQQLEQTTLLSYIFYDGKKIIYDAVSPASRFQEPISEDAYFPSHSIGKSLTSYLIGHAICQGYIQSIDEPVLNWPLMENTLYYGQPLINLLNMSAGDTTVIDIWKARYKKSGRHIHNIPLKLAVQNEDELKNSKPAKVLKWSYSNLTTDVLTNYLMYRVGTNYERFLTSILQNKIGIARPVFFRFSPTIYKKQFPTMAERITDGTGEYAFIASRYDFLRIALAMLEDWQNHTCEGQYLKEIYSRRVKTGRNMNWGSQWSRSGHRNFSQTSRSYGGQFWVDVHGLEKQTILAMTGYNGQQMVINMENGRIVVMHAAKARHYDSKRLGLNVIKNGELD